jgi:hypothetical protein
MIFNPIPDLRDLAAEPESVPELVLEPVQEQAQAQAPVPELVLVLAPVQEQELGPVQAQGLD